MQSYGLFPSLRLGSNMQPHQHLRNGPKTMYAASRDVYSPATTISARVNPTANLAPYSSSQTLQPVLQPVVATGGAAGRNNAWSEPDFSGKLGTYVIVCVVLYVLLCVLSWWLGPLPERAPRRSKHSNDLERGSSAPRPPVQGKSQQADETSRPGVVHPDQDGVEGQNALEGQRPMPQAPMPVEYFSSWNTASAPAGSDVDSDESTLMGSDEDEDEDEDTLVGSDDEEEEEGTTAGDDWDGSTLVGSDDDEDWDGSTLVDSDEDSDEDLLD